MHEMYHDSVVAITIRNVPQDLRDLIAQRAQRAGQSMQEFLLSQLDALARKKSIDDWLAEVECRLAASEVVLDPDEIVKAVRTGRDDPGR